MRGKKQVSLNLVSAGKFFASPANVAMEGMSIVVAVTLVRPQEAELLTEQLLFFPNECDVTIKAIE